MDTQEEDQDDWEPDDYIKLELFYGKYKCAFLAHEAYMKQIISIANSPVYSYVHRVQWAMRELRVVAEISQEFFLLEVSGDFDREKLFRQIHQTLCLILSTGRYGKNIALQPICFGLPVYWKGMSMFAVDLGITLPWKLETDLKKIPFRNFHNRLISASKALDKVDNRTAWAEHTWDEEVLARKRKEKERANGGDPRHWSWKYPETLTEFLGRKGKEMDRKIQRNVRNIEQKISGEDSEIMNESGATEKDTTMTLDKELGIWDKTCWVQRWLDLCPKKLKSLIPAKIQTQKISPTQEELDKYDTFKWLPEEEEIECTQRRLSDEIAAWTHKNGGNVLIKPPRKRSRWDLSQDQSNQCTGLQKIAQAYRHFREPDEEKQDIRIWQMTPKQKSPNIRRLRRRRAQLPYLRNKEHRVIRNLHKNEKLSAMGKKQEDTEVQWNSAAPGVSRMDTRPIPVPARQEGKEKLRTQTGMITKNLLNLPRNQIPTSIEQIEQNIGRLTTKDTIQHDELHCDVFETPIYEEVGNYGEERKEKLDTLMAYELSSVSSETSGQDGVTYTATVSDWSRTTEPYGEETQMEVDPPNYGIHEETLTNNAEEQTLRYYAL